ncbi:hypothetical protein ACIHCV_07235 [Streptomyces sp. NPDC051956]|uniref:hypothetical protein n=1 Tax=Streptomyces sp. NPDC051956 TaxID=3365677 RepID=UPI0037D0E6D5
MNREFPMTDAERIYLSDVEPHSAAPIDSASDLRSRVLLHVLFADTLLIGDAQSLNNKYFRALVSAEEAGRATGGALLSDLALLLEEGRIRVARRVGLTLRDLRDDHERRNVENVPGPAYADRLDALTSAHIVPYDGAVVGDMFKSGVLHRIEAGVQQARGGARIALDDVRQWAADQEVLLYKALRDWLDVYRKKNTGASAEVILALQSVDDWAGESYRQALPSVLDAGTASPRDEPDTIPASRSRRILEQAGLPAAMLDNFLLSQLPVEVLFEATAQPSRNALVRELARLRRGLQPDTSALRAAVDEFSSWMLETFDRTFRGTGGRAWDHLQGQARLMRFGLDEDPATGRLGAGLEVRTAAADTGQRLSFHVVNRPAEGTEDYWNQVARRPVRDLDPLDRVVTF